MILIRRATRDDAGEISSLLNEIITAGGSTALETPTTAEDIAAWMANDPDQSAWHVARDSDGTLQGFQWIERNPALPPDALDIATFARVGGTRRGVGTALFNATKEAARALGASWINAAIRSDNPSGLAYYTRMGFVDYKSDPTVALSDGTVTGKTFKRLDL